MKINVPHDASLNQLIFSSTAVAQVRQCGDIIDRKQLNTYGHHVLLLFNI